MEALPIQWIREVPPITRGYLVGALAVAVCHHAGFPRSKQSIWPSNDVVANIWQVFDNGTISLGLLTNLYFFSQYSTSLETASESMGEFVWELMIILTMLMGYSTFIQQISNPSSVLRDIMLYLWTMLEPDTDMALAGIFFFKARYFPWLIIFMSKFIDGRRANSAYGNFNWKLDFVAIIIGHIYWFIKDQLPRLHSIKSPFLPPWKFFQELQPIPIQQQQQQQEEEDQEVQEVVEHVENDDN